MSAIDIPEDKVVEAIVRELVKREAMRRIAAKEAQTVVIPELRVFADMLLTEMAQTQYRIDNWQPINSRVILSAQNKSGKTTMRDNLTRSLVDGVPWLDTAPVEPIGIVTIIDNEMSERQAIQWLKDQGIQNIDQINFVALRGQVSKFNILDDALRTRWANMLRGTDYLIFDCLRPALDALGLDEQRDAGKFLGPFDELMAEAGINESLIVHHMGHSSGRARGDSRLRDWPDVEWFLERKDGNDPSSERFVRAYGRDVDIPKGKLVYDSKTRHLSYKSVLPLKEDNTQQAVDAVGDYLIGQPPTAEREIEQAKPGGFGQKTIRRALDRGKFSGRFDYQIGPKNAKLWFVVGAEQTER